MESISRKSEKVIASSVMFSTYQIIFSFQSIKRNIIYKSDEEMDNFYCLSADWNCSS